MPPKSGKTKAEKEKLKREAEEQARIAEEEAQLVAQQEERERRKREKTEAIERKKREREELKKRVAELDELRTLFEKFKNDSSAFHSERRRQARWDRYMLCDGSPDPTIPQEINTYLNLWREDEKRVSINEVLSDSKLCLRLIQELQFFINDWPKDELETAQTQHHKETVTELQRLLQTKLDRASHELLLRATELADLETANLQKTFSNDDVTLCLWGNLIKNPRIKTFEFENEAISFDIPKVLTMSECAYRILFTKYDHYSPLSKSFHPQLKVPEVPEEEVQEEVVEEEAAEGQEGGEDEEAAEEEEGAPTPAPKDPTMDLMAELNRLDGEVVEEEEEAAPEPEEEIEPPPEDLRASPLPLEWEDFDGEEDSIDLRASHIIGPVFHLNLLTLPPQPKAAAGWTLRRHVDPPALIPLLYVPDEKAAGSVLEETSKDGGSQAGPTPSVAPSGLGSTLGPGGPVGPGGADKKEEKPPIKITYKIPENLYFAEEPQVAKWDEELKEWRTDGLEVVKFSQEEREIQFKTTKFGVLAFFQDFHINMPFQSWEIRPLGVNSCLLTVIASINEISLRVEGQQVFVQTTSEKSELKGFPQHAFTVPDLIAKLRNSGINIFPREDSAKYVSVPDKNRITEERLYHQMALLSSAMAFSWSRWNTECQKADSIVVQACEHLTEEAVNEDAWGLYTVTRKRVDKLHMKEFDEAFTEDLDEEFLFHADFWHAFEMISSEEGKQRAQAVDFQYLDTVHSLLKAVRPLIFS